MVLCESIALLMHRYCQSFLAKINIALQEKSEEGRLSRTYGPLFNVGALDFGMRLGCNHLFNDDASTLVLLNIVLEGHKEDALVPLAEVSEALSQLRRPPFRLVRPLSVPFVEAPGVP